MALAGTYEVSIISLIWRRLYGRPLPHAEWSLRGWGLPINIFAALYGLFVIFVCALPAEYPVTAADFNWAPVMFGGVKILSMLYYFVWARRIYKGPVVYCADD